MSCLYYSKSRSSCQAFYQKNIQKISNILCLNNLKSARYRKCRATYDKKYFFKNVVVMSLPEREILGREKAVRPNPAASAPWESAYEAGTFAKQPLRCTTFLKKVILPWLMTLHDKEHGGGSERHSHGSAGSAREIFPDAGIPAFVSEVGTL